LNNVDIKPLDPAVGKKAGHRITFTTTHTFVNNGMIRVVMPPGINIGKPGTIIKLTPKGGNMTATQGIVRDGNVIEIINIFGSDGKKTMKAPFKIDFITNGTQNPTSTKYAGKIVIVTYTQINGKYYEVDTGEKKTSFNTVAGKIRTTIPL